MLGLGPIVTRPNDVVVLLDGKYPFVLRQIAVEWLFLSETYVRDNHIMLGQAVTEVRSARGRQRVEKFRIW